jgi:hypothetical protein
MDYARAIQDQIRFIHQMWVSMVPLDQKLATYNTRFQNRSVDEEKDIETARREWGRLWQLIQHAQLEISAFEQAAGQEQLELEMMGRAGEG